MGQIKGDFAAYRPEQGRGSYNFYKGSIISGIFKINKQTDDNGKIKVKETKKKCLQLIIKMQYDTIDTFCDAFDIDKFIFTAYMSGADTIVKYANGDMATPTRLEEIFNFPVTPNEEMLKDKNLLVSVEYHANTYKDTNFQLYQKYTYEDVCRLLNWQRNMNAQNIGGYFYDEATKTLPVFINYDKSDDAIAYEDRFVSDNQLIALSKHPRKVTSSDVTHIYKRSKEDKDNRIFLFVRKNKDDHEAKEFYFLGEMFAEGDPHPIHMESTNDDAFEIMYHLDVPVRNDIYDYIVSG